MTGDELSAFLDRSPGWRVENGVLVKTFRFASFPEAIAFVARVATLAEKNQHHPDIDIRYNRVTLRLVTHDAGCISGKDLRLAALSDEAVGPAGA